MGIIPVARVCTPLRNVTRAVTRLYDAAMAGAGISIAQFSVLRDLARNASLPLS